MRLISLNMLLLLAVVVAAEQVAEEVLEDIGHL
jgi:hypothetical protein